MTRSSYAKTFSSSNEELFSPDCVVISGYISSFGRDLKIMGHVKASTELSSWKYQEWYRPSTLYRNVGMWKKSLKFSQEEGGTWTRLPSQSRWVQKKSRVAEGGGCDTKAWQPTQETNTVLEGAWERQSSSLSPSWCVVMLELQVDIKVRGS